MSTSPQPSLVSVLEPQWVKTWLSFVKGHERLLIIVLGAALAFHFYSKAINAWDAHEQRMDSVAQQQVIATQKQVDADATANKQLAAQLEQMRAQYLATQRQLEAAIAAETAALKNRTAQDNALPLPDLGIRWTTLLDLKPGDIITTYDNKLAVTAEASHTTVNELEKVPVLTQQLAQTNVELSGCKTLSTKQDSMIAGLNTQITDSNSALTAEKNARVADAKLAKAAQRKSFVRGFKWGFAAGAAAVLAVRVAFHF